MKNIENNTVDCFICDLPYGSTDCKWDCKINLEDLWRELKRIARNDNTPYFFFCDMRFGVEIINSNPKMFRYDLVWYKPNSNCGHLNSGKMPMRNHELLLVFYKKLPTYNKDKYHKKICDENVYKKDAYEGIYETSINTKFIYGKKYDIPLPKSVLNMSCKSNMSKKRFHKTEKSQDILEWILKYYTNEGDTILDPTMGSGSCGVACVSLHRKFIGIEKDEKYFEVAKKRLSV